MNSRDIEPAAPTICLLSSEHPPFDKRVFEKVGVSLAQAGFRVVHLCPGEPGTATEHQGVGIVTYSRRRGKLHRLLGLVSLGRRARALRPDAYHCNEPDSWLVGVVLRWLSGSVVVFDCHEHYPGQVVRWLPAGLRRPGAFATRYLLQVLGLLSHRIVLAKRSVADDFSWSRNKQLVVLNTTPLRYLSEDPAGDRDADPSGVFRFVHIGVIRRERGSEQLLLAVKNLAERGHKDFCVVLVGEFKDGTEEEFVATADRWGVRHLFEFHSWMPFPDAFSLVRSSHAGLILFQQGLENNVRALPHKMFDYMLAGLPVIGPNFAPDVVAVLAGTGAGLLIDTSDVVALADAMEHLMLHREEASELGRRGKAAVLKQYNWEREAAKLVEMYRTLLSSNRGRVGPHPRRGHCCLPLQPAGTQTTAAATDAEALS